MNDILEGEKCLKNPCWTQSATWQEQHRKLWPVHCSGALSRYERALFERPFGAIRSR